MPKGKKIILGVTGSIAAYKSAWIVRLLVSSGAEVRVVMTHSATGFITPLTMSTLSGSSVGIELSESGTWVNHVHLGRWADLLLIAPASAHTLGKMAAGLCDNLLTAVYLSCGCPVAFAPAMDEDMWLNPAVQSNIEILRSRGHHFLPVDHGELASGLTGEGRMAEPSAIAQWVEQFFSEDRDALRGVTVLVTAGPTTEAIDPVRYISNHSSGRMGIALAEALRARGAEVELVLGPTHLQTRVPGIHITPVRSAEDMRSACLALSPKAGIIVMAAAVADYRPRAASKGKIKKLEPSLDLRLERTPDILKELGTRKSPGQILVGFSLETDPGKPSALRKLKEKQLDLIVLNSLSDQGAGFGGDTNKITIFEKGGNEKTFPLKPKAAVAEDIVSAIVNLKNDRKAF